MLDDGISYREVAIWVGTKSMATVARLRDEHRRDDMNSEVREAELADLAEWQSLLREAAELVLAGGDKPEKMAELATARAKLSRERRMILGIDKPTRSQLDLRTNADQPAPDPHLADIVEDFHKSKLADRLTEERNAAS